MAPLKIVYADNTWLEMVWTDLANGPDQVGGLRLSPRRWCKTNAYEWTAFYFSMPNHVLLPILETQFNTAEAAWAYLCSLI